MTPDRSRNPQLRCGEGVCHRKAKACARALKDAKLRLAAAMRASVREKLQKQPEYVAGSSRKPIGGGKVDGSYSGLPQHEAGKGEPILTRLKFDTRFIQNYSIF
jgi:hypothetical protein